MVYKTGLRSGSQQRLSRGHARISLKVMLSRSAVVIKDCCKKCVHHQVIVFQDKMRIVCTRGAATCVLRSV